MGHPHIEIIGGYSARKTKINKYKLGTAHTAVYEKPHLPHILNLSSHLCSSLYLKARRLALTSLAKEINSGNQREVNSGLDTHEGAASQPLSAQLRLFAMFKRVQDIWLR